MKSIEMDVWDLPGKEQYRILNRMFLRDTNVALIVYDCSKQDGLQSALIWLQEVKEYAPTSCLIALVGSKQDKSVISPNDHM